MKINPQIHAARLFSTVLCMTWSQIHPRSFADASIPIILSSVLCLIIPHGALDHIVFYQMYSVRYQRDNVSKQYPRLQTFWMPRIIFYSHYLFIMSLWYLSWSLFPSLTLLTFLILSAYHFGEGDLDYIQLKPSHRTVLYLSRGLYILFLLIFHSPESTWPILSNLINLSPKLLAFSKEILLLSTTGHLILLSSFGFFYSFHSSCSSLHSGSFPSIQSLPSPFIWGQEIVKALFLYVLFHSMNPLIAFTLYLGLWHSIGHSLSEIAYLKCQGNPLFSDNQPSVSWNHLLVFLNSCLPFTLISSVSMALAYGLSYGWNIHSFDDIAAWTLFVISISILTGPHLWIVAAMHSIKVDLDPFHLARRGWFLNQIFS